MKYRVTVHTSEFSRGQIVELDPSKMQTQERLQKGIVVPIEADKPAIPAEFRETKVVQPAETKPKRRKKKASINEHSQND